MKKSLIALSLGTFALGIAEFVMMGILSPIAHDLDVSIVDAGHLISAYALGVSFGAPMLLVLRKMPLKKLLVILACMIAAGNCLAAFSVNYWMLLGARFISPRSLFRRGSHCGAASCRPRKESGGGVDNDSRNDGGNACGGSAGNVPYRSGVVASAVLHSGCFGSGYLRGHQA